ncbi:MAG: hypothetical protein CM1200mP14_14100 [Gammaproteobacteria bacterium]|nr:MAG: hypothetical protein CM1200mP14_14100 [Gammaproteobacteria bacterium]
MSWLIEPSVEYRDLIGQLWTDPLHVASIIDPGDLAKAIKGPQPPLQLKGLGFWVLSFYVGGGRGAEVGDYKRRPRNPSTGAFRHAQWASNPTAVRAANSFCEGEI